RQDSGGNGTYRGGLGQIIQFSVRTDKPYRFPTMFDRLNYPASGLDGGGFGAKAEVLLNNEIPLEPKRMYTLNPEDTVTLKLPGAGGYGDPVKREPKRVLDDVLNGYISQEAARKEYGVVVEFTSNGWEIVEDETESGVDEG
ncbi:MAG TPA: hydantoinase B/oxoprolinase family protein, partial [Bacillales bacterium]